VLVPDLIGFGQSDKPKKEGTHTLGWHVQILLELLERLGIRHLVLLHTSKAKPLALSLLSRMDGKLSSSKLVEYQVTMKLSEALLEAPFPDRGHQAGPRAMNANQIIK
jgi:tRNA(adenine34) deaminase